MGLWEWEGGDAREAIYGQAKRPTARCCDTKDSTPGNRTNGEPGHTLGLPMQCSGGRGADVGQ